MNTPEAYTHVRSRSLTFAMFSLYYNTIAVGFLDCATSIAITRAHAQMHEYRRIAARRERELMGVRRPLMLRKRSTTSPASREAYFAAELGARSATRVLEWSCDSQIQQWRGQDTYGTRCPMKSFAPDNSKPVHFCSTIWNRRFTLARITGSLLI